MTCIRSLALLLAVLATAGCGSAPPSASPAAPTPVSTWDPRRDEIDQAQAVWTAEQPGTYAYTSTVSLPGMYSGRSRVSGIDGHIEILAAPPGTFGEDGAPTIEALFDRARNALAGDGKLTVAIDQQYGYPSSLEYTTDGADGSWTHTVTEFTTPGDHTANPRAREALDRLLERWDALITPAWDYTWTRTDTASAGSPTGWVVRHADGETLATAAGSGAGQVPPDAVTIHGTVAGTAAVMAAGGWVDVATDDAGLDVLLAVDPSPATKGDGYWIRIDFTDRAAEQQRKALDNAKERWARAALKKYSYTWAYDGEKGAWSWTVAMTGETGKFLKKSPGAPPVEGAFAPPRIPETFALIEQIIASGGTIQVTYDKALGYPRKVVIADGGAVAPKGTVTVTRFKTR